MKNNIKKQNINTESDFKQFIENNKKTVEKIKNNEQY